MRFFRWTRVSPVILITLAFVMISNSSRSSHHRKKEVRIRSKKPGIWSEWSSWSTCTRSCGGGIRTQTRQCRMQKKWPKVKGKIDAATLYKNVSKRFCEGRARRHHLCNTHDCPPAEQLNFRQSQCQTFDNRPFMGKIYQWESYIDNRKPCSLVCRAKGSSWLATLKKSVIDGTSCNINPAQQKVCIRGKCTSIGCDGIAGSQRSLDRCGICGGDNSTCRVISGIFTRPHLTVGYNTVTQIPTGACNLNVTQIQKSQNFLALRKQDGDFILNGNWRVSWPGEYEGAGTTFHYTRQNFNAMESIFSKGPLEQPVDLMVLYQRRNPGIQYEYTIPNRGKLGRTSDGKPSSGSFNGPMNLVLNPQSRQNYDGKRRSSSSSFHGSLDPPLASDESKSTLSRYEYKVSPGRRHFRKGRHHRDRSLNRGVQNNAIKSDKKFAWKITGYTNCSEACGGGVQRSVIRCVRTSNSIIVSDRRCQDLEKPSSQSVRCNVKPCPARWDLGPWSSCSKSCGEGLKTRSLRCLQRVSPTLTMEVASAACLDKKPKSEKKCKLKPCHHWETSDWSQCSARCGNGIRRRIVTCREMDGTKVEDESCEMPEKPAEIAPCNMGPCEGVEWFSSKWSHCDGTCGSGIQSRHVVCSALSHERKSIELNLIEDSNNGVRDNEEKFYCDEGNRPASYQKCQLDPDCHQAQWFTGLWGKCSGQCSEGFRTRPVLCLNYHRSRFRIVDDSRCDAGSRPAETELCNNQNICPERWFTSRWTDCEKGLQTRQISCRESNWTRNSYRCRDDDRPIERQSCEMKSSVEDSDTNSMHLTYRTSKSRSEHGREQERPRPSTRSVPTSTATVPTYIEPNEEPDESTCEDQYRNCPLVVQARLCRYKYYRSVCCSSCNEYNKLQYTI